MTTNTDSILFRIFYLIFIIEVVLITKMFIYFQDSLVYAPKHRQKKYMTAFAVLFLLFEGKETQKGVDIICI